VEHIVRTSRWVAVSAVACLLLAGAPIGCRKSDAKPTTRPARLADRTDDALADPFGYSPKFDRTDISGGDLGHLDKDGVNRDLNHVFNP
jgi:hypothetical protein